MNPHFLFDSLNSLSVLIGESPQQAERFVDEMAQVYRYQLQAHRPGQHPPQADLTTLGDELEFLRSYVNLLATRYGHGLEVVVQTAKSQHGGGLLPLTLQTLVDNAIRHNVVAPGTPLRIDILTTPGGQVQVRNTLQKRTVRMPVNREGLATLQARYRLLGGAGLVQVEVNPQHFTVSVQLVPY